MSNTGNVPAILGRCMNPKHGGEHAMQQDCHCWIGHVTPVTIATLPPAAPPPVYDAQRMQTLELLLKAEKGAHELTQRKLALARKWSRAWKQSLKLRLMVKKIEAWDNKDVT